MTSSNSLHHTKPWILSSTSFDSLPQKHKELAFDKFQVVSWPDFSTNRDKYQSEIKGILIIKSFDSDMSEEFLRSFPKLKVVASDSVGINHLNLPLLKRVGLKVGYTPDVLTDCVADLSFGLLLAAARRFKEGSVAVHGSGEHGVKAPDPILGTKVWGTTLGIVGMGRIGIEVARRASGFKMRVLYHNRTQRCKKEEDELKASYCSTLGEMLPQIDFLVLLAPLTETTTNLIGMKEFRQMKPTAMVINVSRGQLITQDALVEALQTGLISGAGLDVTYPEPLPRDHPLLNMPNVYITPHIGSATTQTRIDMMMLCINNLQAGIDGRELPAAVPDSLYQQ